MLPVLTLRPVPEPFGLPAPGREPPWLFLAVFLVVLVAGVICLV